jgi:citrate synthase
MNNKSMNQGLESITAAKTRLSRVDGQAGELTISGYPLAELAPNASFEETVFVLWHDRLPTTDELSRFHDELRTHRAFPNATLDVLRGAADNEASAMDALRMGTAAASLGRDEDSEADSLAVVAQTPTIVAAYWRLRNGETPLDPRDDLSHAANYLYMLTGEEPTDAQTRGLETYLNSVVDHGLNASTFTARTIVSTESDVISAVTGAVGALKGPLHGGAPGPVLDMLHAIRDSGDATSYLEGQLNAGERIMGFGHRVYNVRDPRAEVLSGAAERFYEADSDGNEAFFDLTQEVEETAVEVLEERKPGLDLNTNVEFYTAVLLHGIGVPQKLFTPTFAVSRVGGWTAHCREQLADNRLIRPRAEYIGETDRIWTPLEQRAEGDNE